MSRLAPLARPARLVVALAALAAGCGPEPEPPGVTETVLASLALAPDDGGVVLAGGFRATVFADSLPYGARQLAVRANGDVHLGLVAADDGLGSFAALRDADGDGRADTLARYGAGAGDFVAERPATGLHTVGGVEYVYAAPDTALVRWRLGPGDLAPTGEPETVATGIPYSSRHEAKPFAFDGAGSVYVNVGAPSNACQEDDNQRGSPALDPCPLLDFSGGIWRFDDDALGQRQADAERFATGLRHVVALDWYRAAGGAAGGGAGALFALQMGRDRLDTLFPDLYSAEDNARLPAEEMFRVDAGDDLGWPYCYYNPFLERKVLAPEYGGDGETAGRCADSEAPIVAFPAHWSPVDLVFYHGRQFPERYRGGAFVAFHGSWNRAPEPQAGYLVAFQPFADGRPSGPFEVFADGFTGVDTLYNRSDARFRPVGLDVGPDGSLYVSDSQRGRVWQIVHAGGAAPPAEVRLASVSGGAGPFADLPGAALYAAQCGSCHQPDGDGVADMGIPPLDKEWVSGDEGRLIRLTLHGARGPMRVGGRTYDAVMPGHAFLSDREVADVLTYVRARWGDGSNSGTRPVTPGQVAAVRAAHLGQGMWEAAEPERATGVPDDR